MLNQKEEFVLSQFRTQLQFNTKFSFWAGSIGRLITAFLVLISVIISPLSYADDTVCASVKIQIQQKLTLERQAFDAKMTINNTTDTGVIENVSVDVNVTDENGVPVRVTTDPNDLTAQFFIRISNLQSISAVDGTGTVSPKTSAVIDWLLIPAPGSANSSPLGKKYLVGATLKYRYGGVDTSLAVSPDVVTVMPLPLLTLDYFLTQNVWADDPLTPEIEPPVPFTLGVRIKNNGFAAAQNLKIESAQPKIVENTQGLLIGFKLDGSYVNDAPVANSLLANFGNLAAGASTVARWVMETTLAGKFTDFTASFSHSDELGGALTSILQATNAHFLIHDVRVDLPGRDLVKDFLAQDGDIIRVYESEGLDTVVTDRSSVATLTAETNPDGSAGFKLNFPATAGFGYVQLPDPFNGTKALGAVTRSDAKQLLTDNVWLSKTRNDQTKKIEYWVNFFDVNTTGIYDSQFQDPPAATHPPVIQFIPDQTTTETKQVAFVVQASSPDGKPVSLSATPLPAGATFTPQAADPKSPGLAQAILSWTPAPGSAGSYLVNYTATDGTLSSSASAAIQVKTNAPPPGPAIPTISSPLSGAKVTSYTPTLAVTTSTDPLDPTTLIQYEVYTDAAETQLLASASVNKVASTASAPMPTTWVLPTALLEDTHYWWRARGSSGSMYSAWVNGTFFVNQFNHPPESFNLTSPAASIEVASLTPLLTWTNSIDKDEDVITYKVRVYSDAALATLLAQSDFIAQDPSGSTNWIPTAPLVNHSTYYWQVIAQDALDAQTLSASRSFVVNTGNTAPTAPILSSPSVGARLNVNNPTLMIQNSTDAENDPIVYTFEIDTVNTFDSGNKKSSGPITQNSSGNTSWVQSNLVEDQHYWWRVKASDGRAETPWVVGSFLVDVINSAPPAPTISNPGNGAWTASLQPSLQANVVVDPEGDAVSYQFEVYSDSKLTKQATAGTSPNSSWVVPIQLNDKSTYWWRVRAVDALGAASAWSVPAVLYVSSVPYQNPTIAVTDPSVPMVPTSVGAQKQVSIKWNGVDPNIDANVALYYSTSNSGFAGNLIIDGLSQSAGSQTGQYTWDVTSLPSGTYYVYAVIYDPKGVGRAYAPGAVVIPTSPQKGGITVISGLLLSTTESGQSATFNIHLSKAPIANVVVPLSSTNTREGVVTPQSLTFTPQNWSTNQTVTVTGQHDCAPDSSQTYQVLSGKAQTIDPDYIGLTGKPVDVLNINDLVNPSTTNNTNLFICHMHMISQRQVNLLTWESVWSGELTNIGATVKGVTSTLSPLFGITIVSNTLTFGAVSQGETSKTNSTVTLRQVLPILIPDIFATTTPFRWKVVIQP